METTAAPPLSILLPFRNAESAFEQALASICAQNFGDFELVAVDDHSTDRSREILGSFHDARFRIADNSGAGLVDALNYGASQCRGDWLVRMDADDIMHVDRLEKLLDSARRNPESDLIASQVEILSDEPVKSGYLEYLRWQNDVLSMEDIDKNIYVESPFAHPSVMIRKESLERFGGYRNGDFPEDYELWLRMHKQGALMHKIPEVLLKWRDSPGRMSRNHSQYRRAAFDRLRAHYLFSDPRLQSGRPVAFWGAGRKTRKRSQHLVELGVMPSVWIDIDPRKIGNRVDGTEVVGPDWLEERRDDPFILIYVASHGARDEIASALHTMGYNGGRDFLAVG